MFGADIVEEEKKGIIPRCCDHIFKHIQDDGSGSEFVVKCSFLEIYKEVIRDLLQEGDNLKVRETPSQGVWVQGLSENTVNGPNEIIDLLKLGEQSRSVAFTKMNATSSRSHSLFIINIHQKTSEGSVISGKLNLADLAGSEKVGKTGAKGDTLEEAKKINQSLAALGNCINALTTGKPHIPYRNSKLTFILRESLGGNSKTTLIIACSPHSYNMDETVSTLEFGKRAKAIKNNVKINAQRSVKELEAIIENLSLQLHGLKYYASKLELDILNLNPNYNIEETRITCQNIDKSEEDKVKILENDEKYKGNKNLPKLDFDQNDDDDIHFGPPSPRILLDSIPEDDDLEFDPIQVAERETQRRSLIEQFELDKLELNEEITKLTADNDRFENEIKTLKDENESLNRKLNLQESPDNNDGVSVILKEVEMLKKQKEDLSTELNKRIGEILKLKDNVNDKENYISSLSGQLEKEKGGFLMKRESRKMMSEVRKLRSVNSMLQVRLTTSSDDIEPSDDKMSELISSNEQLKVENQNLTDENQSIIEEKLNLEEKK